MFSNESVKSLLNEWYEKTGDYEITDYLCAYLYTPTNIIGFFLNLINFLIFLHDEFSNDLQCVLKV